MSLDVFLSCVEFSDVDGVTLTGVRVVVEG